MKYRHLAPRCRPFVLSSAIAALVAAGLSAEAANKTWDGGGADNNWLTGANWDLDTPPASNDTLIFAGTTRLTPTNDFTAGALFNGITFNVGAGAFTLSGNSLTLTPAVSAGAATLAGGNITNNSTNVQTIKAPLVLAPGNHTIVTAASSGQLNIGDAGVLGGTVTRNVAATVVFTKGAGNINLTGSGLTNDSSAGGGLLGGWALIGLGTNLGDWAKLDASGNVVAYTGYATIAPGGTIATGTTQNLRVSANGTNITMATSGLTDINTLLYNGTAGNQVVDVGVGNTLRLGAQGGIMNVAGSAGSSNRILTIGATAGQGTLTAGGADNAPGELFLTNNVLTGTNNDLVINTVVANNGGAPVTVSALGYVVFPGGAVNTYSGGTHINQGRVTAANTQSFGSGAVNVYPGGQAFLNNNGTFTNDFFIAGNGPTEVSSAQTLGAIRMNTGATTIAGTITLTADARISGGSGGNNVFSGRITGPGRLEFTAATGNNGSINLSNFGAPNDWSGGLLITSSATGSPPNRQVYVKLGADEQIPDGAGKGDVTLNGTTDIVRFDLNGRNETINGLMSAASANNQVANFGVGASTLTLGAHNGTASFAGTIQDGGGANTLSIVKIGSGTQTFAGANTYAGTTAVGAGTLAITGSLLSTGTVNVNTSATNAGTLSGTGSMGNVTLAAATGANVARIAPGATSAVGAVGTLTLASLTVNGGNFAVDLAATSDLISVTGAANFAAASTITPSSNAPNGTYAILTAGALTLTVSPTVISPTDTRKTFTPDFTVANTIQIVVAGTSKTLNWTGATNGAWDLNTTPNWNDGAIAEKYFNGDTVNFGDGPTNRTVTLTGLTVTPAAVNVTINTGDYTITGTGGIGGSTALVKLGSSKLIVATNNTFTGGTTNGLASTLQVGNGGTSGSLGAGSVINDGTLALNFSGAATFANVISGAGNLQQNGVGTVTLSGVNSYSGTTTIAAGSAIRVTNAAGGNSSVGSLTGGAVSVTAGGALDLSGNLIAQALNFGSKLFSIAGTGTDGTGAIINNGVSQFNSLQQVALTADAMIGGAQRIDIRSVPTTALNASLDLAGHTLTKSGANQFSLVGVNVSDGDIIVNQGILSLETVTAIPDFGSGKKITLNAGTTLQFFGNTALTSAITRPMVFNGAGSQIGNANNVNSIIGSPITLNGELTVAAINGTTAASTLTLTGDIGETGVHSLTKTGASVLALSGNNTFSGGITINGGTVQTSSATALGAATAPLTINTGGTLDLVGNNLTVGALSGTGGTITSTVFTPVTLTAGAAADQTFAGVIQDGFGPVAFTKKGAGKLVLSGANTFTGATNVAAGTLIVGDGVSGSLSGSAAMNVASGATLGGSGNILLFGGNVTLANGASLAPGNSAGTLTLDLGGGQFDISGAAAGTTAFKFELGTTSDKVLLSSGALVIGSGVLNLNDFAFTDAGGFGPGTYTLFDAATPMSGSLGSALTGTVLGFNATLAQADGGNDLVLIVVPEPGVAASLLGGLGVLALRRKRFRGSV